MTFSLPPLKRRTWMGGRNHPRGQQQQQQPTAQPCTTTTNSSNCSLASSASMALTKEEEALVVAAEDLFTLPLHKKQKHSADFDDMDDDSLQLALTNNNNNNSHNHHGAPMNLTNTTLTIHHYNRDTTITLQQSFMAWTAAADALFKSPEAQVFLKSSHDLGRTAASNMLGVALWPVTAPIHVAHYMIVQLPQAAVSQITQSVGGVLVHVLRRDNHHSHEQQQRIEAVKQPKERMEADEHQQTGGGAIVKASPPAVTDKKQHQHTSERKPVNVAVTTSYTKRCGDDNDTQATKAMFDRLRLDYYEPHQPADGIMMSPVSKAKLANQYSEFLLRVDDLGLDARHMRAKSSKDGDDGGVVEGTIHYVDLSSKTDESLIQLALYKLTITGVSLLANHPTVRLTKHYKLQPSNNNNIEWKPEGASAKLLRRMAKMSTLERLHELQHETLVWSGKFISSSAKPPCFLARGMIPMSVRDLLHLLWDNARTSEYNPYSVRRDTLLVLDGSDKVLQGAHQGAKLVRSETRVPFTKVTVTFGCLMHVRPLEPPDEGYVIVSRTLDAGASGVHLNDKGIAKAGRNKNEILWGVNILRRVPNHPHLVDLVSLSQVASTLVPAFLAHRIGLLGVHDFFQNVRGGKHTAATGK
jgi:hypothetical protein